LYLTVLGFALSVVGGILVAILVTYSSAMRKGFYPVIVVSQVVPKISIAPLFVVWFGTGTMSSLLLGFLVAFFPMTINAAMGFTAVDEDIHRMARTFMGSRWQIFWKIRMPNALPYIFGGMKISITLAIIGVRIRRLAGRHRLSHQARRRSARHAADDGGDHRAQHHRARALRPHRRGGVTRRLLAIAG